jgi:hypothetical protein
MSSAVLASANLMCLGIDESLPALEAIHKRAVAAATERAIRGSSILRLMVLAYHCSLPSGA